MDIPFLLLVLLALPLVVAAVIIAVARRRGRARVGDEEPVHRLQSDTATVQDAVVHPPVAPPTALSGRARRAASARTPKD